MTTLLRALALGVFFLAVTPACGPTAEKCSTATCTGCCDATGACQPGGSNLACGVSGGQCVSCQAGQSCTFGVCGGAGAGGGTGGGTTGGGTGGGTTGGGTGGGTTGGGTGGGTTGGGTGGGTTGGGTGGGSSSYTQFCLDYYDASADLHTRCPDVSAQFVAEIRAMASSRCSTQGGLNPAYGKGRVTFDATAAAACLSEVRQGTCTTQLFSAGSACTKLFPGAVPANGSCFASSDCVSGLYCDISMTCPGRCVARVALGQPATRNEQCVSGGQAYGGVCVALIPVGQSCAPTGGNTSQRLCVSGATCNTSDQCVALPSMLQANGQPCNDRDLFCGLGLQCVQGSCSPLVTPGNACDSVRRCQYDLNCNAANVCALRGAAGAACVSGSDCKADFFCNTPSGATSGTCAARRTVDQTCTYNGYECDYALYCTATSTAPGVCKAPLAAGQPCTYAGGFQQCAGYCTATANAPNGVCANKKGTGASCNGYQECLSSSCTSNVCGPPSYCFDSAP